MAWALGPRQIGLPLEKFDYASEASIHERRDNATVYRACLYMPH